MFFTKKVRQALLETINERVHTNLYERQLESLYDYIRMFQTEIAALKKQVKKLVEEKEKEI